MKLHILDTILAVHRLPPDSPLPPGVLDAPFSAVTRTAEELSIVCDAALDLPGAAVEPGWAALQVAGPLDFSLIGILAALATPLAAAGIPIFALSTFDTDYLLVKQKHLDQAVEVLRAAGHQVG